MPKAVPPSSNVKGPLRWLGVVGIAVATGVVLVALERLTGARSPLFAFNLHFTLMGAAVVVDHLVAPALTSRRFEVSPREVAVYRRLGVGGFMRILRRIGWTRAIRDPRVFDGTRRTVASYERATRHGENAHAALFLIVLVPIAWVAAKGWWDAVFWLGSMNVAFHAYPVMLQRSQRLRLLAIVRRLDRSPP